MEKNTIKPPKKTNLTRTNETLKGLLKAVTPGATSLLIDLIVPSIHEKRLDNWRNSVYDALIELSEKNGFSIYELRKNPEFITILKQCLMIASRNHQEEKLHLIKNAILKSINSSIDTDYKLIFNRLLDELTVTHIRILKKSLDNSSIIGEIKKYEDYYKMIVKDDKSLELDRQQFLFFITELTTRNLLIISTDVEKFSIVSEDEVITTRSKKKNLPNILITDLAKEFLNYIID